MTIQEHAANMYKHLQTVTRDDGTTYIKLAEDMTERERYTAVIELAHDGVWPEDTKYQMIQTIAEAMSEADDPEEIDIDSLLDIYDGQLIAWFASANWRAAYVDQAQEEGLLSDDANTVRRIAIGQYMEYQEIHGFLLQGFREMEEEDEAAEFQEDDDEEENDDEE